MRKRIDDAILFEIDTRRDLVSVDILACKRCPLCLTSFNGEYMTAALVAGKFPNLLYVTHYCASCERVFLGVYQEEDSVRSRKTFKSISCIPKSDLEKIGPQKSVKTFPNLFPSITKHSKLNSKSSLRFVGWHIGRPLSFS